MGLIVPQTVKVRTGGKTCKHYREKGYEFEKCGDLIEVNVLDLPKGSNIKVKVVCDICGKITEMRYARIAKYNEENKLIICGNKICKNKKREDTCMKKYGVKHAFQAEEVKEKTKQTNLKNWGVEYASQAEEVKEKIKQTNLKNWGVEYTLQSEEIRNKGIQTLKEKYGEDITNVFQATEVKEKIKQTNLKNWGVEYATQSEEIKEKTRNTNNEKYGADYYTQTDEYKDRAKKTCQLHHGVDNPSQSQEIKNKKIETCRKHWGVDYPFQSDEVRSKTAETLKEKYGESIINISQVEEIRDKIKSTCEERYGAENPMQNEDIKNKVKNTNLERYRCICSLQSEEAKNKSKETMLKNHGVEHALQNKEILNKVYSTNLERYGSKNYFSSDDFKNKTRDTWSFNGHEGPCSRQQKYIANLVNGKINEVIAGYWADIILENEKINLEYDGGGHRANCDFYHKITSEEFDLKEKIREEKIYEKGYKTIRIISKKDKLPSDEVILNLIKGFKNSDFKVIRIDIDEGTIDRDYKERWYCNFGELRKITKEDLEKFEKQEENTSEN